MRRPSREVTTVRPFDTPRRSAQRSAGQLQRPSRIAVWRAGNAELDIDLLDVTEVTGGDELPEPLIHRLMQVVEAFHDLTRPGPGDIAYQRCFGRVAGRASRSAHACRRSMRTGSTWACRELTSAL